MYSGRILMLYTMYIHYAMLNLLFCACSIIAQLNPDSLRSHLPSLADWAPAPEATTRDYHSLYGLDATGIRPVMGTFTSDSFMCVGQCFIPDTATGTVFFLHGFLDHTGTLVNGITPCIDEGWAVAAMDLPGHGLSGGERGAINDFVEYAAAFDRFFDLCSPRLPRPFVFVGHSTGCAVGLEWLHREQPNPFRKVIFLAPLVRGDLYHLSRFGNAVLSPFVTTLPRWFRDASHDRAFLKRFRNDPLQSEKFPMRWAKAFYTWHDRIGSYGEWSLPLVIVQGSGDRVVEWRYNLPWLQEHIPGCRIVMVDGARHQLLNESEPPYRGKCLDAVRSTLQSIAGDATGADDGVHQN